MRKATRDGGGVRQEVYSLPNDVINSKTLAHTPKHIYTYPFLSSFNKHLASFYLVPGRQLGAGITVINQ